MNDMQNTLSRLAELNELAKNMTPGEWFWSARTLRSTITSKDSDGDEVVESIPDIIKVDEDRCCFAKQADQDMIIAIKELLRIANELAKNVQLRVLTVNELVNVLLQGIEEWNAESDSFNQWTELATDEKLGVYASSLAKLGAIRVVESPTESIIKEGL